MFLLDDIVLRGFGISIPGLDMLWTIEQIRSFAYREFYNPEKIKSSIKENRLLYEFGEMNRDEYERKNNELLHKLKMAQRGQEMNIGGRMDILGVR
ncbi:MAG: gas vesicle protein GvpG [Candidatus Methanoperedens sp.]|nr:gas vesicle protein GvpG [Candidatus Methanoperedens sp.]